MPQLRVTVADTIDVPEGAEIVLAPTGIFAGVRLPSGDFLKPWLAMEHFVAGNEDGDPEGDLSETDLNDMGVTTSLDFEREVEVVDGDVTTDDSNVGQQR